MSDMCELLLDPSYYFAMEGHTHCDFLQSGRVRSIWDGLDFLPEYLDAILGQKSLGKISPEAIIKTDRLYLGEGAEIQAGACIEGPAWIGPGSIVRHGAYIRANVLVGANCLIGHSTEIKHSVMFDGAHASHFAYIGDSIVGRNVLLGAGVRLANSRLDGRIIGLTHVSGLGQKEFLPSGRTRLGAIIGDHAALGCNCVANPGSLISPKSQIPPLTQVRAVWRQKDA